MHCITPEQEPSRPEPESRRVCRREGILDRRERGVSMKQSRLLAISLALLALAAARAFAQVDTGVILGTVRDPSGAVLPGAMVTLTHKQTGINTRATTDSRGNYEAPGLAIGTYTVKVALQGFRDATRENVDVRIQDRLRIDFNL